MTPEQGRPVFHTASTPFYQLQETEMSTQESDDREQRASNISTLMWWTLCMVLIALAVVALIYLLPMWRGSP
jgi:hypothetical protein